MGPWGFWSGRLVAWAGLWRSGLCWIGFWAWRGRRFAGLFGRGSDQWFVGTVLVWFCRLFLTCLWQILVIYRLLALTIKSSSVCPVILARHFPFYGWTDQPNRFLPPATINEDYNCSWTSSTSSYENSLSSSESSSPHPWLDHASCDSAPWPAS